MVEEQQDPAQEAYIQSAWRDPAFHKLPLEDRRSWMNATDPDFLALTYGEQDKLFTEAYQKYAVAPPKPVAEQNAKAETAKAASDATALADPYDPTANPIKVPMSDQFTLNDRRSREAGMRAIPHLLPSPEDLIVKAAQEKQAAPPPVTRQARPALVMPGSTGPIPGQDQIDVGPDIRNVPRQIGSGFQSSAANMQKLVHNAADVAQRVVESDDPYTSQILSPIRAIPGISSGLESVKEFTKPYQTVAEQEATKLAGGRTDAFSQILRGAAQAPGDLAAYGVGGEVLGPIGGMAAVDALREADKGLVPALEAGAKGALTGGAFEMMNPLTRPLKIAAGAAMGALPPALEGRPLEDIVAGGATMGGLAGMHGGPVDAREAARTAADYARNFREPLTEPQIRSLEKMSPQELLYWTRDEQRKNREGDVNMAGTELADRLAHGKFPPTPSEITGGAGPRVRPPLMPADLTGNAQVQTLTPEGRPGRMETLPIGNPAARPLERGPNRDERRAGVAPPETMGSEDSERDRDARARLAQRYFGKRFGELEEDERAAVDAGLRKGHGYAAQPGEEDLSSEPPKLDWSKSNDEQLQWYVDHYRDLGGTDERELASAWREIERRRSSEAPIENETVPHPISEHPDWQTWTDADRRLHTVSPDTGQTYVFDRDYGWNPVGKPEAKAPVKPPAPEPESGHPARQPVVETEGVVTEPQVAGRNETGGEEETPDFTPYWARTSKGELVQVVSGPSPLYNGKVHANEWNGKNSYVVDPAALTAVTEEQARVYDKEAKAREDRAKKAAEAAAKPLPVRPPMEVPYPGEHVPRNEEFEHEGQNYRVKGYGQLDIKTGKQKFEVQASNPDGSAPRNLKFNSAKEASDYFGKPIEGIEATGWKPPEPDLSDEQEAALERLKPTGAVGGGAYWNDKDGSVHVLNRGWTGSHRQIVTRIARDGTLSTGDFIPSGSVPMDDVKGAPHQGNEPEWMSGQEPGEQGHPAGRRGSMADDMPEDWHRWSDLQAKRGGMTDAEWDEFVKLDEKYGPPSEGGSSQGEPGAEKSAPEKREGAFPDYNDEELKNVFDGWVRAGGSKSDPEYTLMKQELASRQRQAEAQRKSEEAQRNLADAEKRATGNPAARPRPEEKPELTMRQVKEIQDEAERVLALPDPRADDSYSKTEQMLGLGNLDRALNMLPADFPPQMRTRLEVLRNKLREKLRPKDEFDDTSDLDGGDANEDWRHLAPPLDLMNSPNDGREFHIVRAYMGLTDPETGLTHAEIMRRGLGGGSIKRYNNVTDTEIYFATLKNFKEGNITQKDYDRAEAAMGEGEPAALEFQDLYDELLMAERELAKASGDSAKRKAQKRIDAANAKLAQLPAALREALEDRGKQIRGGASETEPADEDSLHSTVLRMHADIEAAKEETAKLVAAIPKKTKKADLGRLLSEAQEPVNNAKAALANHLRGLGYGSYEPVNFEYKGNRIEGRLGGSGLNINVAPPYRIENGRVQFIVENSSKFDTGYKGPPGDRGYVDLEKLTPGRLEKNPAARPPAPAPEETGGREPWQMSQQEYLDSKGIKAGNKEIKEGVLEHGRAVTEAYRAGQPVPASVVNEYPYLKSQGPDPTGGPAVIIACAIDKVTDPQDGTQARNAYQGTLFNKSKAYAEKVGTVYRIFSAKYGLLHPDWPIQGYDVTFNRAGDPVISPEELADQIRRQKLAENYDSIVVVAGKKYVEHLRAAAPDLNIETPFGGMQIGELQHALGEATAEAEQNPDARQYEPDISQMTPEEAHKHLRGLGQKSDAEKGADEALGNPAARPRKTNVEELEKRAYYTAEPNITGLPVQFLTPDSNYMTGKTLGYKLGMNAKGSFDATKHPVAVEGADGKRYWVPVNEMQNQGEWLKGYMERAQGQGNPAAKPKDINARIAELEQIVRGHAINAPEDASKVHDALRELTDLSRQRDDARIAVLEAQDELTKAQTLELAKLRAGKGAVEEPAAEADQGEEGDYISDPWVEANDWYKERGVSENDFEAEQEALGTGKYSVEAGRKFEKKREQAVIDALKNGEEVPAGVLEDFADSPAIVKAAKEAADKPAGHPAAGEKETAGPEQPAAGHPAARQPVAEAHHTVQAIDDLVEELKDVNPRDLSDDELEDLRSRKYAASEDLHDAHDNGEDVGPQNAYGSPVASDKLTKGYAHIEQEIARRKKNMVIEAQRKQAAVSDRAKAERILTVRPADPKFADVDAQMLEDIPKGYDFSTGIGHMRLLKKKGEPDIYQVFDTHDWQWNNEMEGPHVKVLKRYNNDRADYEPLTDQRLSEETEYLRDLWGKKYPDLLGKNKKENLPVQTSDAGDRQFQAEAKTWGEDLALAGEPLTRAEFDRLAKAHKYRDHEYDHDAAWESFQKGHADGVEVLAGAPDDGDNIPPTPITNAADREKLDEQLRRETEEEEAKQNFSVIEKTKDGWRVISRHGSYVEATAAARKLKTENIERTFGVNEGPLPEGTSESTEKPAEPPAKPEPTKPKTEKTAEPKKETKIHRSGDAVQVRVTTEKGDEWVDGEVHEVKKNTEGEPVYQIETQNRNDPADKDFNDYRPEDVRPAPPVADKEADFAKRYQEGIAETRRRNHVDKVDDVAAMKTVNQLTKDLLEGKGAAVATVGKNSAIIHENSEVVGKGKSRSTRTSYLSVIDRPGKKNIQMEFTDPRRAAEWTTDVLHQIGFPPGWDGEKNYDTYGRASVSDLLKRGTLLKPNEAALAASEAAARAIGRPGAANAIYRDAFAGGAWSHVAEPNLKLADVATKYAAGMPRDLGHFHELSDRRDQFQRDVAQTLMRDTSPKDPIRGWTWESQLEHLERTAKGLEENELTGMDRRIELAKDLNGGETSPRIAESEKMVADARRNIKRNLKAATDAVKETRAAEKEKLGPVVKEDVEAYAKYGPAAFTNRTVNPEIARNQYAKAAGLESSSWPAMMEHFDIESSEKPERIPIPLNGPAKLTKAEIDALDTADLASGTIRPKDQGTTEKLTKRGWIDDTGALTEKGKSAVYSHRAGKEEVKAGLPMDKYEPRNKKLHDMGETRFGGGGDAWGMVGKDLWYTNGHGAWKGEFPSHWPARNKSETHKGPDLSRVIPEAKGDVVKPIGFAVNDPGEKNAKTFIYFDNANTAMDAEYYDHSLKQGVVKWTQAEGKAAPFQGWDKDGKRIALVMPMRIDKVPEGLQGKEAEAPKGNPAARKRNPKTGMVSVDMLTGGTPRWIQEDLIPQAQKAKEGLQEAASAFQRGFAPQTLDNIAQRTGDALREYNGERAHETEQAIVALKKARKYFQGKDFKTETLPFLNKMEKGEKQDNPELQPFADEMRKQLDRRREEIRALGTGKLQKYYTDYFPHLWKFDDKAREVFMDVVSRGPTFEGSKDFLKKRSIDSIADGVERGLKPKYENPVDSVLAQMHQMDKYILAHKTLNWMKEQKMTKYLPVEKQAHGAGQGWVKYDDPIFTRYGKPQIEMTEFNDAQLTQRVNDLAKSLGIKHERYFNPPEGGPGTAGYTKRGTNTVVTKFATPESTLIHEIGHQLEFRYGLMDKLKGIKGVGSELRDLADLRYEGVKVSENYKSYVRNKDEKMANAIMALVYAPEKFKQVAPVTWDALRDELYDHKELRPIFDLDRSLVLGSNKMKMEMPGITTLGHYYIPKGSAGVFRNFLSQGLRKYGAFRAYLGAANHMNQFQLGASAYHAGFTTFDSWISKAALAMEQASRGHYKDAAISTAKIPFAPVANMIRGHKLLDAYRTNPQTAEHARMVDALVSGGGRTSQDNFYATKMADRWMEAAKSFKLLKTGLLTLPAIADLASRPIMEHMVPRMKLGAFADIAKMEMQRLDKLESNWKDISEQHYDEEKEAYNMEAIANDPALDKRGKLEAKAALRLLPKSAEGYTEGPLVVSQELKRRTYGQAWDSVDNRMGQMVYDNQFFHKTMKDLMMASIRSVGWNVGTLKEHGGGLLDMNPKKIKERLDAGDPAVTHRMAYLAATPMVVGLIGSIMTKLATGENPKDMKDRFFPRTGAYDINGRPERRSMPTYMRDWAHIALAAEDRDPGAIGRMVTAKLHPAAAAVAEMLNNEDYYGTQVIDKDHLGRSLLNWGQNTMTPFAWRAYQKEVELGGTPASKILPFVGVTPAPSFINKTRMERFMDKASSGRVSRETRTQEQGARGKVMRDVSRAARLDDQDKVQELTRKGIEEGHITLKDAVAAYKRGFNEDPVQRQFKGMDAPHALKALEIAEPEELKELMPEFKKKLAHFLRTKSANERDDIVRELKKSGLLPLVQQPSGHPASR